jgi:cellulose 1,4-beta-cellobiosidase
LAGYAVWRSLSPTADFALVANTTASQFQDNDRINGTTYYYVVSAHDSAGNNSPASDVASATPLDGTAPAAPADLVTVAGENTVF